jgi:serine protease inhibitor
MRKLFAAILFGVILFSLCSCVNTSNDTGNNNNTQDVVYPKAIAFDDQDAKQKLREENPIDRKFIKSVNTFSYDTTQALLKNRTDNFNYSPLSLYYALALTGTGADGETQQQIFKLLDVSSAKELSAQCGNLYRLLYTDNEISKLKIANSLWLDDDINIKDTFVSNAENHFYASAFSIDFSNKDSAKIMAQWISENTNGTLVPDLKVSSNQLLSMINTVYFFDEWVNRFDKDMTKEDTFYAGNKELKDEFMNKTFASSEFARGDNYTRSSLNLKGNGQMVFILPDEGVPVSDLISSKDSVESLFEGGKRYCGEVVWKIPKFKFGTQCNLTKTLQTMGITNAFQSDADFSGITDDSAFISDVIQQTHIAIDENGVEASAFTQISYFGAALPNGRAEMILNRPFLYGITSSNGILLFVGVCNNPIV